MDLQTFFKNHNNCGIGFSGGVDSSYLLYAGVKYGAKIKPYFVKTQFQPNFELIDAKQICDFLGVELTVIEVDILKEQSVRENPIDRCYHCKSRLFSLLKQKAKEDGFDILLDGTNASDDVLDRPGMKAIDELKVLSPLRLCGLTKANIRKLSKQAGLFTHDKPSYACLATRVPTGVALDANTLLSVEKSEDYLSRLSFKDFRVRVYGNAARLQLKEDDIPLLLSKKTEILKELKEYFDVVMWDLEVRK